MSDIAAVTRHYSSEGIAGRVLEALHAGSGAAAAVTPESLAPRDHFHRRGLLATWEMAARLAPRPGERLLDIGSGISAAQRAGSRRPLASRSPRSAIPAVEGEAVTERHEAVPSLLTAS